MSQLLAYAPAALVVLLALGVAWRRWLREPAINALARVGLVRVRPDGTVRWPVSLSTWGMWRVYLAAGPRHSGFGWFGVFRNKPGVARRVPGRWLPARWGVRVLGLELGDRGGHPRLLVLREGRAVEPVLRLRLRSGDRPRVEAAYIGRHWFVARDLGAAEYGGLVGVGSTLEEALQAAEEAERTSWACT